MKAFQQQFQQKTITMALDTELLYLFKPLPQSFFCIGGTKGAISDK